jgi:hypothetical protein
MDQVNYSSNIDLFISILYLVSNDGNLLNIEEIRTEEKPYIIVTLDF